MAKRAMIRMSTNASGATTAKARPASASEPESRSQEAARLGSMLWRAALVGILLLAFALRAAVYLKGPRPIDGAGLVAVQGEMARNIIDHRKWFVVNQKALDLVTDRQNKETKLIDPARLDFSRVDQNASYEPEIQQMPGVAPVLAGVWWVTGRQTYSTIQWLQILVDTFMVLLVYWIAQRLSGRTPVAIIAALLYAIWPGAIVVSKRPMLDTWAGFFVIGLLAVFLWAREQSRIWRLIPLGILTGLGLYFRPFVILLPIALALVATPRGGWRRRLAWAAVPTVLALLILSPWTIRNAYDFHRFIPFRTGLGQAVYDGLGSNDAGASAFVHKRRPDVAYGSPEYDNVLLRSTARTILDRPGHYLWLVTKRARLLLPCLLLVLIWRRWRREGMILVAVALATIVPYLPIGSEPRFYLPAAFAYFILAAMAVDVTLSSTLGSSLLRGARTSNRAVAAAQKPEQT
jgi:4-amino-4-deoxy-L-arabinose transferase-like glycosyltransferase